MPLRTVQSAEGGFNVKSPAFQFYPTDWLGSQRVQMLTLEEEGAYIRLLSSCWQHGSIPADPTLAARIVGKGCSTTVARVVQAMFEPSKEEGRLVHDRLELERIKQVCWREKSSAGGKKSAELRENSRVVEPPFNGAASRVVQHSPLLSSSPSSLSKGGGDSPHLNGSLGTSERITLEKSLVRLESRLLEIKEADLPGFREERKNLKAERTRILGVLDLKA